MLLVVGLLCGGLVSLLLLNTVLAQGSIKETTLRSEIEQAKMQQARANEQILRNGQPGAVADGGAANGMKPDASLNLLDSASDKLAKTGE